MALRSANISGLLGAYKQLEGANREEARRKEAANAAKRQRTANRMRTIGMVAGAATGVGMGAGFAGAMSGMSMGSSVGGIAGSVATGQAIQANDVMGAVQGAGGMMSAQKAAQQAAAVDASRVAKLSQAKAAMQKVAPMLANSQSIATDNSNLAGQRTEISAKLTQNDADIKGSQRAHSLLQEGQKSQHANLTNNVTDSQNRVDLSQQSAQNNAKNDEKATSLMNQKHSLQKNLDDNTSKRQSLEVSQQKGHKDLAAAVNVEKARHAASVIPSGAKGVMKDLQKTIKSHKGTLSAAQISANNFDLSGKMQEVDSSTSKLNDSLAEVNEELTPLRDNQDSIAAEQKAAVKAHAEANRELVQFHESFPNYESTENTDLPALYAEKKELRNQFDQVPDDKIDKNAQFSQVAQGRLDQLNHLIDNPELRGGLDDKQFASMLEGDGSYEKSEDINSIKNMGEKPSSSAIAKIIPALNTAGARTAMSALYTATRKEEQNPQASGTYVTNDLGTGFTSYRDEGSGDTTIRKNAAPVKAQPASFRPSDVGFTQQGERGELAPQVASTPEQRQGTASQVEQVSQTLPSGESGGVVNAANVSADAPLGNWKKLDDNQKKSMPVYNAPLVASEGTTKKLAEYVDTLANTPNLSRVDGKALYESKKKSLMLGDFNVLAASKETALYSIDNLGGTYDTDGKRTPASVKTMYKAHRTYKHLAAEADKAGLPNAYALYSGLSTKWLDDSNKGDDARSVSRNKEEGKTEHIVKSPTWEKATKMIQTSKLEFEDRQLEKGIPRKKAFQTAYGTGTGKAAASTSDLSTNARKVLNEEKLNMREEVLNRGYIEQEAQQQSFGSGKGSNLATIDPTGTAATAEKLTQTKTEYNAMTPMVVERTKKTSAAGVIGKLGVEKSQSFKNNKIAQAEAKRLEEVKDVEKTMVPLSVMSHFGLDTAYGMNYKEFTELKKDKIIKGMKDKTAKSLKDYMDKHPKSKVAAMLNKTSAPERMQIQTSQQMVKRLDRMMAHFDGVDPETGKPTQYKNHDGVLVDRTPMHERVGWFTGTKIGGVSFNTAQRVFSGSLTTSGWEPLKPHQAEFYAEGAIVKTLLIKAITGAQMGNEEAKRILEMVPMEDDSPVMWREKNLALRRVMASTSGEDFEMRNVILNGAHKFNKLNGTAGAMKMYSEEDIREGRLGALQKARAVRLEKSGYGQTRR